MSFKKININLVDKTTECQIRWKTELWLLNKKKYKKLIEIDIIFKNNFILIKLILILLYFPYLIDFLIIKELLLFIIND